MHLIKENLNKKDCGIVATYNAMSWCGQRPDYDSIRSRAILDFGYSDDSGITFDDFEKMLLELEVPIVEIENKNLFNIQGEIYLGRAIVLGYKLKGHDLGHISIVFYGAWGIRIINKDGLHDSWDDLAAELNAGGASELYVWKLPN